MLRINFETDDTRRLHDSDRDFLFWPVVELLDELRPGGNPAALQEALDTEILVLDDLGADRATDWTTERLYRIINRRWMEQRPIVATTNLETKDLRESLGERCYSRLVGDGAVCVRLGGEDRRRG